jgi:hypothetical protein
MVRKREPEKPEIDPGAASPIGVNGVEPPLPSHDGGIGDFEQFAISTDVDHLDGVPVTCRVGAPKKGTFFRCHPNPDYYKALNFLEHEIDGKRRQFLILSSLLGLEEVDGLVGSRLVVPYITQHGLVGVWLVSIEHADNTWVSSAMGAIRAAKATWTAATAKPPIGQYLVRHPAVEIPEPSWPDWSLKQWYDVAFPADVWIKDREHVILRKLRGEV